MWNIFKGKLAVIALALPLAFTGGHVDAAPVKSVYFLMDASGSIDATEFTVQRNAYATVLSGVLPTDGSLAVGFALFGGGAGAGTQNEIFATQAINAGSLATLIGNISGLDPTNSSLARGVDINSTNIAGAVDFGVTQLNTFDNTITRIIDVSTDGAHNTSNPLDAVNAVNNAIIAGISAVNCIGVGLGADCSFIGANGFTVSVSNVSAFEAALAGKVRTELEIPEPAALALFGLGLVGLGFARRRKAA